MNPPLFEPPADELPEIPPLLPVEQPSPEPGVADVEATAFDEVAACVRGRVRAGMRVAVGVGSRGIASLPELVRGTVRALRAAGADPFIVPAMGSHGGGTADGQVRVVESFGVTETSAGAPIRSTMEVVRVGRALDMDLYLDTFAAEADVLFPVNRVKSHTCFDAPIESGLAKMLVIGYGKQWGARAAHALSFERFWELVPAGARAHCDAGRVLGGLASVENGLGEVAAVKALGPEEIGLEPEADLLRRADELLGHLPFDEVDVLVVDRLGKNVSGVGIDPNVTGRFGYFAIPDRAPAPKAIVALSLTEAAHGNGFGVGLADVIPLSLYEAIDWADTHLNGFTSGRSGLSRGKCPIVVRDGRTAIRTALAMVGALDPSRALVARIRDTSHVQRLWLSPALLAAARGVMPLPFDPADPAGHRFLDEG